MVRQAPTTRTVINQTVQIFKDLGPLPESRKLETIWVLRKLDGKHVRVNERDYGSETKTVDGRTTVKDRRFPERHFDLAPDYDPEFDEAVVAQAQVETRVVISGYSEADLRGFQKPKELKCLPEWKHVDPARRYKNIGEMVDAILEVRDPDGARPVTKRRKGKVSREPLDTGSAQATLGT